MILQLNKKIEEEAKKTGEALASGKLKSTTDAPYSLEYINKTKEENRKAVGIESTATSTPNALEVYLANQAQNTTNSPKAPTLLNKITDINTIPGISTHSETQATLPMLKPTVDNDPRNKLNNTKFIVNNVNENNLQEFSEAQKNGTLEYWFINDTDNFNGITAWDNTEIGRSRLAGVKDNDDIVFYDRATKKLYRLDKATDNYEISSGLKDVYTGLAQAENDRVTTRLGELKAEWEKDLERMAEIAEAIEAGKGTKELYDEFNILNDKHETYYPEEQNNIIEQYDKTIARYSKNIDKYQAQMDAEGLGLTMSKDQAKAFEDMARQYDELRERYGTVSGMDKMIANYDDDKQVNSLIDLFKKALYYGKLDAINALKTQRDYIFGEGTTTFDANRSISNAQINNLWKDAKELFNYTIPIKLIKGVIDGSITKEDLGATSDWDVFKKIGTITLSNWLVNAGESMDFTNLFIKPFFIGAWVANDYDKIDFKNAENIMKGVDPDADSKILKFLNTTPATGEVSNADDIKNWYQVHAGINAVKDAWGLNGTLPNYDWSDVISPDEDAPFLSKKGLASLALEMFLDPGTYLGAIVDGRTVQTVSDSSLKDVLKDVADIAGIKVSGEQLSEMTKQIARRVTKDSETLETAFTNVAQSLLKVDPKIAAVYEDTMKRSVAEVQAIADAVNKQNAAKFIAETKSSLSTALPEYDTIMKTIDFKTTYKSFEELVFNVSAPGLSAGLKALGKFGTVIQESLKNVNDLFHANLTTNIALRINGQLSSFVDEAGDIITGSLDDMSKVITKEITTAASLLENSAVLDVMDKELHKGLVNTVLNKELESFNHIITSTDDVVKKINDLNERAFRLTQGKALETNDFATYIKSLQETDVFKKALDPEVVSQLEYLSNRFSRLKVDVQYANVSKVVDVLDKLKVGINKKLEAILKTDAINLIDKLDGDGVVTKALRFSVNDTTYVEYALEDIGKLYNNIVELLNRYDISVIEGVSTVDKTNISQLIKEIKTNLTDYVDTLYNQMVTKTDEVLPSEFAEYALSITGKLEELYDATSPYLLELRAYQYELAEQSYKSVVLSADYNKLPDMSTTVASTKTDVLDRIADVINSEYSTDLTSSDLHAAIKTKLEEVMTKDGITFNGDDLSRVYTGMVSKASQLELLHKNNTLTKVIEDISRLDSPINYVIDNAKYIINKSGKDIPVEALVDTLKGFKSDMLAIANTNNIINDIDKSVIAKNPAVRESIIDGIASNINYINSVVRNMVDTSADKVDYIVGALVDKISESASNYISQKDGSFYKFWEHKGVRYNSVDTSANVRNILDNLGNLPKVDDEFYNVYVSTSSGAKNASPFMMSFAHKLDDVRTFRNADHSFNLIDETSKKLYNLSVDAAKAEFDSLSVKGTGKYTYLQEVRDYIYYLQDTARAEGKQLRFVGFNNSNFGAGHNNALKQFFRENNMKVITTSDSFLDLADILRVERGMITIGESELNVLKGILKDGVYRAKANAFNAKASVDVLYDTNLDVLKPLNTLKNTLGTTLEALGESPIAPAIAEVKSITDVSSRVFALHAKMLGKLHENVNIKIDESALIKLIQDNSGRRLNKINIPQLLQRAGEELGDITYNAKKLYDNDVMNTWYDVNKLKSLYVPGVFEECNDNFINAAHKLTNIYNSINIPEVIYSIGADAYSELVDIYKKHLSVMNGGNIISTELDALLKASVDISDDACKGYALAYMLNMRASTIKGADTFIATAINKSTNERLKEAALTIQSNTASELVFNQKHYIKYNEGVKIIEATYADILNPLRRIQSDLNILEASKNLQLDLNAYLNLEDIVYTNNHISNGVDYIKSTLLKPIYDMYTDLVDSINKVTPILSITEDMSELQKISAIKEFSEKVTGFKATMTEVSKLHNSASARTILTLSEEDFITYVIRDCKNSLVINPNSVVMQSETLQKALFDKLEYFKKTKELDYAITDNHIQIYKNFDGMSVDAVHELMTNIQTKEIAYKQMYTAKYSEAYKELLENKLKEYSRVGTNAHELLNKFKADVDPIIKLHQKYLDSVEGYFPQSYYISQYSANTQDAADAVYRTMPASALYNGSIEDMKMLYQDYNLYDVSYNANIIGDTLDKQAFYPQYTENMFSNIGIGINHVKNNIEATVNYFNLYDNNTQSLSKILQNTVGDITVDNVNNALKANGYVLHTGFIDNNKWKVKRIVLRTEEDLAKAIANPRVIATPADVYTQMLSFAKGETRKFSLEHMNGLMYHLDSTLNAYKTNIRNVRYVGWLFANAGTVARNFIDASTKAAMVTRDIPGYFRSVMQYIDEHARYKRLMHDITTTTNRKVTPEELIKYYKTHTNTPIDLERAMYYYKQSSLSVSGGMSDMYEVIKKNGATRITNSMSKELKNKMTEGMVKDLERLFQKLYSKADKVREALPEKQLVLLDSKLKSFIKRHKLSEKYIEELKALYPLYTPVSNQLSETIKAIPGIGTLFTANAKMFSGVEDMIRGGMFKYYTDNYGYSLNRAADFIRESQFEYANRPKWLEAVEFIAPFSTYRIYNTLFWVNNIGEHANIVTKLLGEKGIGYGYDTSDLNQLVHNAIVREQLNAGAFKPEEGTSDYEGVSKAYAEQSAYYSMSGGYYVNGGFSLADVFGMLSSLMSAVPEVLYNKQVPSIITDNVYSPYVNMVNFFNYFKDNYKSMSIEELLKSYYKDNSYDVIDFIPAFGAVINRAIRTLERGKFSLGDINIMQAVPEVQQHVVNTLYSDIMDLFMTLEPSLFGKIKETHYDKPVGFDWYNQEEGYKKMHRYIRGVSDTLSHNPITYINYKAFFMSMGYTEDEAKQLVTFYQMDSKYLKEASGIYQYDSRLFNNTLEVLVNQGYSAADAIELIMSGDMWVDYTGQLRNDAVAQQELENSGFLAYYSSLPDYVKYTEGEYSRLLNYYIKELGHSYAVAQYMIKSGTGYVTTDGEFKNLSEADINMILERNDNTEERNAFYNSLPNWYRYEDGAVDRAMALLTSRGLSDNEAYAFIVGNNYYVDDKGKEHYLSKAEVDERTAQNQKQFLEFWNKLPEFTRYTKGAGAQTMSFLFSLGYDEETVRGMMLNGAYYDGENLIDCRGMKKEFTSKWRNYNNYRYRYNRYRRYNRRGYNRNNNYYYSRKYSVDSKSYAYLPYGIKKQMNNFTAKAYPTARPITLRSANKLRNPYVTQGSFSSTYSKQNVFAGASYGYRQVYKVSLGYSRIKQALSIKSQYPAAYRNLAYAYRRNMYKDMYAKYGTSRMLMRSNAIHGYSNASIVRLRRNNIINNRKYSTRRNNL